MKKKILLGLLAVVVVAGGVAGLSAYEAHIINVTAHIENALYVHPDKIEFGTVFPQEYLERNFTVELSRSFQAQERVDEVSYVIKQKPKCECLGDPLDSIECPEGQYAPVSYIDHTCPAPDPDPDTGSLGYAKMLSLCPFLSKMPTGDESGDDGVESYYVEDVEDGNGDYCESRTGDEMAYGLLSTYDGDYIDGWIVDLKVPPVDGYVGQNWPAGCPTVSADSQDYGCDLWIEVTCIGNDCLPS